jgi:hypothetical protein
VSLWLILIRYSMRHDKYKDDGLTDERPPFGGSWRVLYALVLLWLAAQVVIFYLFTEAFR